MPRFYFDLKRAKKSAQEGATPWTPAVTTYYALQEGLRLLLAEGRENVITRHQRLADKTRSGVQALGFTLFADPRYASNTVTSVRAPEGMDADALRKRVKKAHNVVLAGAQGKLAGHAFRIGHLGYVTDEDIDAVLAALKAEMAQPTTA